MDQGTGYGHPLSHPTGKVTRPAILKSLQPDKLRKLRSEDRFERRYLRCEVGSGCRRVFGEQEIERAPGLVCVFSTDIRGSDGVE